MYISTQIRDGDVEETLQYLLSLSKCCKICSGDKSDLVKHVDHQQNQLMLHLE